MHGFSTVQGHPHIVQGSAVFRSSRKSMLMPGLQSRGINYKHKRQMERKILVTKLVNVQ